ncbi:MAG: diheme cytochrome c [Thiogranum sp.]
MKATLAVSAVIFTIGFVTLPVVWSDGDFRWKEMEEYEHRSTDVAAAENPVYKEECGSCHMAYPPGLLPARSWARMLAGLADHFGDDAGLDPETHRAISRFLAENSADRSDFRRARKFSRSVKPNDAPIRISETPYFRHEHDEIPDRMVTGNPEVKSLSQCDACHTGAERGAFNEHDIDIPGYGRWDD